MWVRAKFYKIPFYLNIEDVREKRLRWYWLIPFLVMDCLHDIFDYTCAFLLSILSIEYTCGKSYELNADDYEEYRRQNSDVM